MGAMRNGWSDVTWLVTTAALVAGCAGAAGPDPSAAAPNVAAALPGPAAEEPVVAAAGDGATCLRPEAAAALDACAAAGETPQPPLPGPEADRLLAQAEEAWRSNRWAECAELHTRLARRHPDPAQRAESAYGALLCVNNREAAASPDEAESPRGRRARGDELARLAPREFTATETTMAEAYARYECLAPAGEEFLSARYRRTRLHYVANHWHEAAVLFRDLTLNHPASDLAPFAANQWLDSLNALARIEPGRREACRAELRAGVDAIMANETLMNVEELREQMTQLRCGLWWSEAEELEHAQRWLEASDRLLQILERHGDVCRQIGMHDQCELLYNAAIYADEGGDTTRAVAIRERLIAACGEGTEHDADRGGRGSEWAKRVTARLGDDYRAMGAHAKAAEVLEGFARQWPGERDAVDALETAAGLRVGLGQAAQALADLALFERNYGGRPEQRGRVASVVFTVGAVHLRAKAWTQAERHYAAFLQRHRDAARPDEVIRALVELGAARWERGGATGSRRDTGLAEAREAVAMADAGRVAGERPEATLARYRSMVARGGEADETIAARVALLVDAVARARIRLGVADPPEDAMRLVGMSAEQAEQVLLGF